FEVLRGRVAFIDLTAFIDEIRRGMDDKLQLLRRQWRVEDVTGSSGPFRLRYTVERDSGNLGDDPPAGEPDAFANFRAILSRWVVEPLVAERGEPVEAALAKGSAFRQVVDGADAHLTVATLWVYADSFP